MNLVDMLAGMGDHEDSDEGAPSILPEAALMRLREAAVRFAEHLERPRFNVGDLVTPSAGGNLMGAGDPHIVVETRRSVEPDFERGDPAGSGYGIRRDMRVLSIGTRRNMIGAHWVESWKFEPWSAP